MCGGRGPTRASYALTPSRACARALAKEISQTSFPTAGAQTTRPTPPRRWRTWPRPSRDRVRRWTCRTASLRARESSRRRSCARRATALHSTLGQRQSTPSESSAQTWRWASTPPALAGTWPSGTATRTTTSRSNCMDPKSGLCARRTRAILARKVRVACLTHRAHARSRSLAARPRTSLTPSGTRSAAGACSTCLLGGGTASSQRPVRARASRRTYGWGPSALPGGSPPCSMHTSQRTRRAPTKMEAPARRPWPVSTGTRRRSVRRVSWARGTAMA
mmetsp:Transcript_1831/g.5150  ORF Transcript_1831/g.5150 Transcript_1831/m.5150 type:complete len:277 (-) Transcript_1831:850-1680(-)